MTIRRNARPFGYAAAALVTWVGCDAGAPLGTVELGGDEQAIINGDVPARGSLAARGVVQVGGGCTGTLLTNQHVLTARHCVREWNPAVGATPGFFGVAVPPRDVWLEGPTAADDQFIVWSRTFEPNTASMNSGDYAVVELSEPMVVNGASDGFFNPIYQGTDASLVGQNVACGGYGWGNLANAATGTFGGRGDTLRTATLNIASEGGNELRLAVNGRNQIGAPGDSGSTCFLDGQVLGVQSTWNFATWSDLDGDGVRAKNEVTSVARVTAASPNAHRAFSEGVVLADVKADFTFAPALPAGAVVVTIETPRDTGTLDLQSNQVLADFAPRSGFIVATVENEPAHTLCSVVTDRVPLGGDAVLRGACLNEGLLAVLL